MSGGLASYRQKPKAAARAWPEKCTAQYEAARASAAAQGVCVAMQEPRRLPVPLRDKGLPTIGTQDRKPPRNAISANPFDSATLSDTLSSSLAFRGSPERTGTRSRDAQLPSVKDWRTGHTGRRPASKDRATAKWCTSFLSYQRGQIDKDAASADRLSASCYLLFHNHRHPCPLSELSARYDMTRRTRP